MLKDVPKDALKTFKENLLHLKKKIAYATNLDTRQNNNIITPANKTDLNLSEKIAKFHDVLNEDNT